MRSKKFTFKNFEKIKKSKFNFKKVIAVYFIYLMICAVFVWSMNLGVVSAQEECKKDDSNKIEEIVIEGVSSHVASGNCAALGFISSLEGVDSVNVKLERRSHNGRDILILSGKGNAGEMRPYGITFKALSEGMVSGKSSFPNGFTLDEKNNVLTFTLGNGKKLSVPVDWSKIPDDVKSMEIDKEKGTVTYVKENDAKVVVGQEGVFLAKDENDPKKTVLKGFKVNADKETKSNIELDLRNGGDVRVLENGRIFYKGEATLTFKEGPVLQAEKDKGAIIEFKGNDANKDFIVTNSKVKSSDGSYEFIAGEKGLFFGEESNAPKEFKKKHLSFDKTNNKLTGNLQSIIDDGSEVVFTNLGENKIEIDSKISNLVSKDGKEVKGSYKLSKNNKVTFKKGTGDHGGKVVMYVDPNAGSSFTSTSPTTPANEGVSNIPDERRPGLPDVSTVTGEPRPGQPPGTDGVPPVDGDPGTDGVPPVAPPEEGGANARTGGGLGNFLMWGLLIGGGILAAMLLSSNKDDEGSKNSEPISKDGDKNLPSTNNRSNTNFPPITEDSENNTYKNTTREENSTSFNENRVSNFTTNFTTTNELESNSSCICNISGCFYCPGNNCFNC